MVSLPGDSASSARLVTAPYTIAAPAQISATSTPCSVRKLSKGTSLGQDKAKRRPRGPSREGAQDIDCGALLPRNPQSSGALGVAGALLLRLGRLRAGG